MPAMALALEPSNPDAMKRAPRDQCPRFDFVRAMNSSGQLVWFSPNAGSIYVQPLFAPGGFVEADTLVGLKDSGELLYFEKAMGDGVPVLPGAYVTFKGSQYNGCAILQCSA